MNNHILRVFSDEMFCCVTPIFCTADDPIDGHDQMRGRPTAAPLIGAGAGAGARGPLFRGGHREAPGPREARRRQPPPPLLLPRRHSYLDLTWPPLPGESPRTNKISPQWREVGADEARGRRGGSTARPVGRFWFPASVCLWVWWITTSLRGPAAAFTFSLSLFPCFSCPPVMGSNRRVMRRRRRRHRMGWIWCDL